MPEVNKILKLTAKGVTTGVVTGTASSVTSFYSRGNLLYAVHLENTSTADALTEFAVYGRQTGGELHALSTDQIFNYVNVATLAAAGKSYCIVDAGGDHYLELRMRGAAALTVNVAIDAYQGALPQKSSIGSVSSLGTLASVTTVGSLGTLAVLSSVANVVSLDTVDVLSSVTNIVSLDTVDVVSSITNIVSLDTCDSVSTLGSVTNIASANTLASIATLGSIVSTVNAAISNHEISAYSAVEVHLNAVTTDTTSDYYPMVANGYGCGYVHCNYVSTAADTAFAYLLARVDSTAAAKTVATIDLTSTAAQTIIGEFKIDFPYPDIAVNFDAGSTNGTLTAKGLFRGGR